MLTLDFPGSGDLITAIDEAVTQPTTPELTDLLRSSLCRLIRDHVVTLPACVFEAHPEHYARRELYRSEEHGYCVVAMTWGPGQGTPIHDHDGMWCVEGVWNGALEIVQYDLVEHQGERYCFQPIGSIQAGTGSAGSLIPPHEYHSIRNPSDSAVTVSLHIYSGRMMRCAVFQPLPEDRWYDRDVRTLGLDRVH
ncbi:MAG: cysteine dioxygenase family protein [Pseudomonadota bacterium]|nr:cysteine dioxygenase family protein [Pseudomonadota bacterium]